MKNAQVLLIVLLLASCSDYNDERGKGDAPVGNRVEEPVDVIFMPDGFSNVATVCYQGYRVFVSTQNSNGKQMEVVKGCE